MKDRKLSGRMTGYFEKYMEGFVFDKLSPSTLDAMGGAEYLADIEVPFQAQDFEKILAGEGISPLKIAENMAWVIGCNPDFAYAERYAGFMREAFGDRLVNALVKTGHKIAKDGLVEQACLYFRAALYLSQDCCEAMFAYAMALRTLYLESDDEEYIGKAKAEVLKYLELSTIVAPDFAQAYYYLGYAYLNMGLYAKAQVTWEDFLEKSAAEKSDEDAESFPNDDSTLWKQRADIAKRLKEIEDPCKIEQGINEVISGRYGRGLEILNAFEGSKYDKMWTVPYYIGIARFAVGDVPGGIEALKKVLVTNASHEETLRMLADGYKILEDTAMEKKYRDKVNLLYGECDLKK